MNRALLRSDKNEIAMDIWLVGMLLAHGWTSALCGAMAITMLLATYHYRKKELANGDRIAADDGL